MKQSKNEGYMSIDKRVSMLETTVASINVNLAHIKENMDLMRQDIVHLRQDMNHRFDKVNDRLWSNTFWTIGAITALAGFIAHLHHIF
jgi:hypothetical protein